MTSPSPDPVGTTARSYDEHARSWHLAHSSEDRAASRAASYDRFTALLAPGGLVLDLGCGSGLDAEPLAARGVRLLGLDVSAGMLRIAASVPSLAGRLLCGERRSLPIVSCSFDGVWADGSLHHLPRLDAVVALREAARVLRAEGVLCVSVERGTFEGFVQEREGMAGRRWYSYYEPEQLRAAVTAAGFAIVDAIIGGPAPHSSGFTTLFARKLEDAHG